MNKPEYSWAGAMLNLLESSASTPADLAKEAGLDPHGDDVASIDLSGLDLRGQDFKGWNLASANFSGAMLSGADLRGAVVNPQKLIAAEDWDGAVLDKALRASAEQEAVLCKLIADQELSIRTVNAFKNGGIITIGDVVQLTEAEALRIPNFGRKSLNEMKEFLAQMGLHLGMEMPSWRSPNA